MVSVDNQSMVNVTKADVAATFINGLLVWLLKHRMGGIGVTFDSKDDAGFAAKTLRVSHCLNIGFFEGCEWDELHEQHPLGPR